MNLNTKFQSVGSIYRSSLSWVIFNMKASFCCHIASDSCSTQFHSISQWSFRYISRVAFWIGNYTWFQFVSKSILSENVQSNFCRVPCIRCRYAREQRFVKCVKIKIFSIFFTLENVFLFTDAMSAPQFSSSFGSGNGTSISSGGLSNSSSNVPGSGYGWVFSGKIIPKLDEIVISEPKLPRIQYIRFVKHFHFVKCWNKLRILCINLSIKNSSANYRSIWAFWGLNLKKIQLFKTNFLSIFSTEVNIIQIIKMKRHQHRQVLAEVRLAALRIIHCRQIHAIATMFKMSKKWLQPMLLHLKVQPALIQPVATPLIPVAHLTTRVQLI